MRGGRRACAEEGEVVEVELVCRHFVQPRPRAAVACHVYTGTGSGTGRSVRLQGGVGYVDKIARRRGLCG